ncbi:MAG: cell division protein FtsA [Patescibacteria group bacterium]
MARSNIYTGIDIGTCKVTTIIVSEDEETEKLRVVGVATKTSRGIRKSQIVDIEETVESITQSVEAAERMAGFSITDAYVSIGGYHIQSQNSKGVVAVANSGEEITGDDVDRVIESARAVSLPASREILHVIPRDFSVDSQGGIKDPLGMTGVRLEVDAHIITGVSTAIRNLVKCVSEIGINVSGVVFSGLAAAESVLTDTEKELGVCLVDIGGGTTSLSVFVEGALAHSSVLPVGAKHVTNDLAIGMRVSLEQAENLKLILSNNPKEKLLKEPDKNTDLLDLVKFGVTEEVAKPSYKTLVDGIVRPRLNEVFAMVGDELKRAGYLGVTPAGIVLSGGGALTVGAVDSCKRTLSLPVRTANLDGSQDTDKKLNGLIDDIGSPVFAVAQGLILYGSEKGKQSGFGRAALPHFGNFVEKFSGKGLASKAIDFIKSFLP